MKYMGEVRQAECLSEEELRCFQLQKIQKLINEKENVPYLANIVGSEENDVPIRSLDDLAIFPIVDKKYIIDNIENFRNKQIFCISSRGTSGSTGQPFKFYRDRFALAYMDAVMYNAYAWHGIAAGERQSRFWGMPFDPKKKREAVLKDFLMNRIRLSAFELTNKMFNKYYLKMCKFHPGYLYGYPSLINEFAHFCRDRGLSCKHLNIKVVVVTGEKLISNQKKMIEEVFSAKVVQEYGCSEVGVIGFECPHGKMHVMSPNLIVEVINDGSSVVDELGEIVVTELNAKSFPFIRYQIGDLGIIKSAQCSCGLKWPVIEIKEGRIDDYIITPEGKKVYDAVLAYTFNGYKKYIKMFKAVQRNNLDLEIKVVLTDECDDNILTKCREDLAQRICSTISITLISVKSIKREKSGKLRYFVSELNS